MTKKVNGAKLMVLSNRERCQTAENKDYVKANQAKRNAFKIRPSKAEGQAIRAYAAVHGISVQALLLEAEREYIANHQGENNE